MEGVGGGVGRENAAPQTVIIFISFTETFYRQSAKVDCYNIEIKNTPPPQKKKKKTYNLTLWPARK